MLSTKPEKMAVLEAAGKGVVLAASPEFGSEPQAI